MDDVTMVVAMMEAVVIIAEEKKDPGSLVAVD
jgi:hypothetical protein